MRSCLAAVRSGKVKALAHITGGGCCEQCAAGAAGRRSREFDARAGRCRRCSAGWRAGGMPTPRCCAPSIAASAWWWSSRRQTPRRCRRARTTPASRRRLGRGRSAGAARRRAAPSLGQARAWMTPHASASAILISGRGSNMAALIEAARRSGVSGRDCRWWFRTAGRRRACIAARAGVATAVVDHRRFAARGLDARRGDDARPRPRVEIVCLAGFMRLLVRRCWSRMERADLNIHPSCCPNSRGSIRTRAHSRRE